MTLEKLRMSGARARQIVSDSKSALLDERQRILRSTIKDLLPDQEDIHGAVLEGCLFLLRVEVGSSSSRLGTAAISALTSQLRRTYNEQTVLEATCFAEGFIGIEESQTSLSRVEAPQNEDPIENREQTESVYSTECYSSSPRIETQEAKMQSPHKLIVAGSLLIATMAVALLGVTTLKVIDVNNGADGSSEKEARNISPQENMSGPDGDIKDINYTGNAIRQTPSSMEDLGNAVGGQKLQLDLSSIKAYPNSARISFRYSLGNEIIDSIADCGRREWMTLPERKWHSTQSAATERMLSRVCEAFRSGAPAISTSGAAIVFDPPSNIRTTPNGGILCSITSKGTIPIQGKRGDWYETDYCGSPGYIHKGQVRF